MAPAATSCSARLVAQRPHDQLADRTGGGAGDRVEEAEAEAERDAGEAEHPAELAATEHRHQAAVGGGVGRRAHGRQF